jgi:hypothetical protein
MMRNEMTKAQAQKEANAFKRQFVYKSDGWLDSFRILDGEGRLEGDCDDAAVSMLWRVEGRDMGRFWGALKSGEAVIWYCKIAPSGARHAILWHRSYGWIENGSFKWTPEPAKDLKLGRKMSVLWLRAKMLLGRLGA